MKELPTMQELQSFITYNKTGSFTLAAQTMNNPVCFQCANEKIRTTCRR